MEGRVWPEMGIAKCPRPFIFPPFCFPPPLGTHAQPLGNSRGRDWVTYELNQPPPESQGPCSSQSLLLCSLLPSGSTLYPPFPFVQFLFLFFLLLNDVVYGK